MANAVNHSVVVIPVLTEKYQESVNCRKEIEFADKRKKPLVPICMQKDYKVAEWLDFLLGGVTSHTLCDKKCYDEELANLLSALATTAQAAKIEENEEKRNIE